MRVDDIGASNQRANEYWQRVGGHPDAGYMDVGEGRMERCEAHACRHADTSTDHNGDMAQCPDCESWCCPAHRVPDVTGHEELCMECRDERDQQRLAVES